MFTPTRPPTKPAANRALAKLVTAGASVQTSKLRHRLTRWGVRLLAVAVALVVLWQLFLVVVNIATTQMWFDSVHHGGVYRTDVEAEILLFCVFGVIATLISGYAIVALRRMKDRLYFSQDNDTIRWLFRKYEPRVGKLIVVLVAVIPGILVGRQAAAGWQTYLMWRHAVAWHTTDPLFHKDISFFVDVYPFHTMVVALLYKAVRYGLYIVVVGGYWYGGWRIRRGRKKIIVDFTRLLSIMLGLYLLLRAAGYWESRYALTTSSAHGPVTGPSYTDVHVGLPSAYVLTAVTFLAALVLFANAAMSKVGVSIGRFTPRGRVRVIAGTLAVLLVLVGIVGTALPQLVFKYREQPSAATLDAAEIAHNQKATLAAFGLADNVTTVPYDPPTKSVSDLVDLAHSTSQLSVLDPNQLTPTFNVQQQLQAYYGFKSTLDVANYDINGKSQDVIIAARELRPANTPNSSWVNAHLVYTHGYGVVAAPVDKVNPTTQTPVYLNGGMPPAQDIPITRPQIYYGMGFRPSTYVIVGKPAGSTRNIEFDHPGGKGRAKSAYSTYQGSGGVPIGSVMRRLLFAVKNSDPNILFSSELSSASQLLTQRNPYYRVAAVAPWLTLDGDVYPAIVDGHVDWIVDGYTTSANYPDSQLVNLHTASQTTLTADGASIGLPNSQANYMQNSVKAVVDAYTGKVTLYEWNQAAQPDPLLKTWESVYPGLVQPQSAIPPALLSQLRYPTDLFNVQRTLLARYHVQQVDSFYSGNDFWRVPNDPTITSAINSGTPNASSVPMPSRYASMSADGLGAPSYSLSSPMATLNGQQLASFISVNSQPGPDYGKFTILEFPASSANEPPAQVQNDIESDTAITEQLTLQRGGNSKVVLGDLQATPVAGRILYVEPVYTQSSSGNSFPVLRHVIALYGNGNPSFEDTLDAAVKDAIQSGASG